MDERDRDRGHRESSLPNILLQHIIRKPQISTGASAGATGQVTLPALASPLASEAALTHRSSLPPLRPPPSPLVLPRVIAPLPARSELRHLRHEHSRSQFSIRSPQPPDLTHLDISTGSLDSTQTFIHRSAGTSSIPHGFLSHHDNPISREQTYFPPHTLTQGFGYHRHQASPFRTSWTEGEAGPSTSSTYSSQRDQHVARNRRGSSQPPRGAPHFEINESDSEMYMGAGHRGGSEGYSSESGYHIPRTLIPDALSSTPKTFRRSLYPGGLQVVSGLFHPQHAPRSWQAVLRPFFPSRNVPLPFSAVDTSSLDT